MNQKNVFYISNINFLDGQNAQEKIDLSFLPPMSRRKLSLVDKAALSVMNTAYTGGDVEIVFASQYGELDRLDKIISQYQQDNEVSPFTFSTSVHNCIAGQFSLLNGIKKSYNALAAGKNTFSAGLLESFMRSQNYGTDVLFCFADAYKETIAGAFIVSQKYSSGALKLVLSAEQKQNCADENEYFLFKDFCNGEVNQFFSSDGVFSVVRADV